LNVLIKTAKDHFRSTVEHRFRVIKRQADFQKTQLRGMLKNRCNLKVLAAHANLYFAHYQSLRKT